jgi:hypothetical protein
MLRELYVARKLEVIYVRYLVMRHKELYGYFPKVLYSEFYDYLLNEFEVRN